MLSKVSNNNDVLFLEWNDGNKSEIRLTDLRFNCPCAHCQIEREESGDHVLLFKENEVKIKNISLSGSYAINIVWDDGHNMGYYEFEFLKKLSDMKRKIIK